jgi:mannose-6-phosphate isomerase
MQDTDEKTIRNAINNGTLMKYLQQVPVKKGDLFFIEEGTVHAIGAGALVAEIQENSNLTYRLYDYDRVDKYGKKRKLHVDKAMAVANLKSSAEPQQPLRVLLCVNGCGTMSYGTESIIFYKGDCIFVPALSEKILIHGQVQFLDVRG